MPNRREFILNTVAASGALALTRTRVASANANPSKPLRILLLGGTGFIGSHLTRVTLERGHKVSALVRSGGKKPIDLPPEVERLPGDRNGDLESLKNRDWDAVIDIATYGPIWVRTLGQALKNRVKHYTLISSVAVYDNSDDSDTAADEQSKLLEYRDAADPYSLADPKDVYQYGALKVLCEREAEKQFPGMSLMIRPTVIVGPNDSAGGFTYLCARMKAGGEMLVGGKPLMPMQLIDVRDMTEWMIRMVEKGETGPVNVAGPAMQLTWVEMLGAIRGLSSVPVRLTWVPVSWLKERKVSPSTDVLFWPTGNGKAGLMRASNDKARAKGLTFRPISVSAADTLAWYESLPPNRRSQVLWPSANEHRSLEDSMAREKELLAAWHARRT